MRLIRKTILILTLLFVLASAAFVAYVYFNKDKIIQVFVNEINNYIKVEAEVGKLDLNSFDHWPYVALELNQTSIRGKNCAIESKLISAQEISILINPLNLIRGQNEINRIYVKDGIIFIYRDELCRNYDIFKESEEGKGQVNLKNITLVNTRVQYLSKPEKQDFNVMAVNTDMDLNVKGPLISIGQKGKWLIENLKFIMTYTPFQEKVNSNLILELIWSQRK